MNVCFNGYNEGVVTFEADSTVKAGQPVMVSANGKVEAADGDFCGICIDVRNGFASVQLDGYAEVDTSGTVSVGYQQLAANSGKLSVSANSGRKILVLDVDSTNNKAGIIL